MYILVQCRTNASFIQYYIPTLPPWVQPPYLSGSMEEDSPQRHSVCIPNGTLYQWSPTPVPHYPQQYTFFVVARDKLIQHIEGLMILWIRWVCPGLQQKCVLLWVLEDWSWETLPYIVHYFSRGPIGKQVVHCVGIRVAFGTHPWPVLIMLHVYFLLQQALLDQKSRFNSIFIFRNFNWQMSRIEGICKQCVHK